MEEFANFKLKLYECFKYLKENTLEFDQNMLQDFEVENISYNYVYSEIYRKLCRIILSKFEEHTYLVHLQLLTYVLSPV